jgi:hypothetical protein
MGTLDTWPLVDFALHIWQQCSMPFGIPPLARAVRDNCNCERTSREEMAEEVVPWGHWIADPNMAAPEDGRRHSELASTFREQWAWGWDCGPAAAADGALRSESDNMSVPVNMGIGYFR